jgi:hypothetical protein
MNSSTLQETPATPAPAVAPVSATPHFTPEELKAFQSEDSHAAAAVTGIMSAIFSIGLLIYLTILYVVHYWPN